MAGVHGFLSSIFDDFSTRIVFKVTENLIIVSDLSLFAMHLLSSNYAYLVVHQLMLQNEI